MDPELQNAINRGDVKHLIRLCETRDPEFFLGHDDKMKLNMYHILCSHGKQACLEESLKRLPAQTVCHLICQTNFLGNTPLHDSASYGYPSIAKLLVDAYRTRVNSANVAKAKEGGVDLSCPPWRVKNHEGRLPLQVAMNSRRDEVAEFLIQVDPGFLRDHNYILLDAAEFGCRKTVKAILTSGLLCRAELFDVNRVMKLVTKCSESDAVLLLQQFPIVAKSQDSSSKKTILHHATELNLVGITETVLGSDISVSCIVDDEGQNPLHLAVKLGQLEIAKLIVDAFSRSYKQVGQEGQAQVSTTLAPVWIIPPWRQTDKSGITPLHLSMLHGQKKIAMSMLSSDLEFLRYLSDVVKYDNQIQSPLVLEQEGFKEVAGNILTPNVQCSLTNLYFEAFLLFLRENSGSENRTKKLISQHPELLRLKDSTGRTILQYTLDVNEVDIMSLILKIHPSAIEIQHGNLQEHILIRACLKGNLSAIHAICDICPQAARLDDQTTALHNIRLQSLEEYQAFLAIKEIAELKNTTDALGRSPLIKAIEDNNFYLAEALLEMGGIDVMNIKSKEGKTAAALLKDRSKESEEWENLYKKATKPSSYIPLGTDLQDMRNTLSVVAALLATITFAAAFTVPGGFDQNTGEVLLAKKASFIVFILADTYAMCCSMFVLYALIWATVQDPDKASVLIDYSVSLLHHSLYGTLGAFMTGVYTMLSAKTIWVPIVVLVMCSSVVVSAFMIMRFKLIDKFIKTTKTQDKLGNTDTELSEILLIKR